MMAIANATPTSPLDLARQADPAIENWATSHALSEVFAELLHAERGRISITVPAQQGTTTIIKWAVLWWLHHRPADHVVIASYSERVALKNARDLAQIVRAIGDDHGFHHADGTWAAASGGTAEFVTAGHPLDTRSIDLFIVDSPLRSQQEAAQTAVCDTISNWWINQAEPRIGPRGHAVIAKPAWTQLSLVRQGAAEQQWRNLNIRPECQC